jgi:hypothetical protein
MGPGVPGGGSPVPSPLAFLIFSKLILSKKIYAGFENAQVALHRHCNETRNETL